MKRLPKPALWAMVTCASLAGCASVVSTPSASTDRSDGLTYFMPRKDFTLTIVKAAGVITSVTPGTTAAYPDLRARFVLAHATNFIGTNVANIGVGTNGLLTSSKATTTSNLAEALANLADSIGSAKSARMGKTVTESTCANATHVFVFQGMNVDRAPCGLAVTITRLNSAPSLKESTSERAMPSAGQEHSGIFYRQEEPYLITVTGELNVAAVVFSPNDAPTRFLPISRALFAKSDSTMEFTAGMPTKYDETREGEVVAAFKLPATVIAAYFAAVGKTFDAFKKNDDSEANKLSAEIKLEMAKKKFDACLAAIQDKDEALIASLECGK